MVERQEKDLKRQKGFAKEEKQKEIISNGLTCSQKIASLIDQSVKNPPANAGDGGSILGLGRSHMPWTN